MARKFSDSFLDNIIKEAKKEARKLDSYYKEEEEKIIASAKEEAKRLLEEGQRFKKEELEKYKIKKMGEIKEKYKRELFLKAQRKFEELLSYMNKNKDRAYSLKEYKEFLEDKLLPLLKTKKEYRLFISPKSAEMLVDKIKLEYESIDEPGFIFITEGGAITHDYSFSSLMASKRDEIERFFYSKVKDLLKLD